MTQKTKERSRLVPAKHNEGLFLRRTSEDGRYEMGFYRVMYGYRVRAGYVGSNEVILDWCGGDVFARLQWLYAVCLGCLEHVPMEKLPPVSDPKPFYNDINFIRKVIECAGDYEPYLNLFTVEEFMKAEQAYRDQYYTYSEHPHP